MRMRLGSVLTLLAVLLVPVSTFAQASLTGTVRDSSGAVLPGVTVEAGSDALIEKTRTAVTDGSGQYRIVDLPSGTYKATFAISGFATVVRDAISLSGTFTATVNVDMRVGGIEETVTITGASPIVDVQSTVRQDVLKGSLITELPAARVRPADRQAPAVGAHPRQPRGRHLQRAQREHGADLQRHLLDGQPRALGHADADHAGAVREDRCADRFLRRWTLRA
jgi:hypothetical protein